MTKIDLDSPDSTVIERAAEVIRQGGVVLYPTDTVYGLGCDPFQAPALRRLLEVKGRAEEKGLLVLVPSRQWAERLASEIPPSFGLLADELWPGPVTFLLPGSSSLPRPILGVEGKIGVRLPDRQFLRQWMQAIPGPVVSTSANRSGERPPRTLSELRELFLDEVDLFLENGEPADALPSTVIDLAATPPHIVREGEHVEEVKNLLSQIRAAIEK